MPLTESHAWVHDELEAAPKPAHRPTRHLMHPRDLPGTIHAIIPSRRHPGSSDGSGENEVLLSTVGQAFRWAGVIAGAAVLMVAATLIAIGIQATGPADSLGLLAFARSPYLAFAVGVLVAAVLQSATLTTSLLVMGLASGVLPMEAAAPVVLGANLGKTITGLLVAIAALGRRTELRRALTAASIRPLMNLTTAILLLPVEWLWHPLERFSVWTTHAIAGNPVANSLISRRLGQSLSWIADRIGPRGIIGQVLSPGWAAGVSIVLGIVLLVASVQFVVRHLSVLCRGASPFLLHTYDAKVRTGAIVIGALVTAFSGTSTLTTAGAVPFAATRAIRMREVLPIMVGTNLGNVLNPVMLVFILAGGPNPGAAAAAMIHVTFNAISVLLVAVPKVRRAVTSVAYGVGERGSLHLLATVLVVLGLYFALPGLAILAFG